MLKFLTIVAHFSAVLQPLPNGNLTKNTTAEPSETINTLTGDTFTVFYGCFSSTVKFKWRISVSTPHKFYKNTSSTNSMMVISTGCQGLCQQWTFEW